MTLQKYVLGALVVLVSCMGAMAQDAATTESAPVTVTVESAPLKVVRTFDGVFESATMTEVSVDPEEFTSLKVATAVPVGTVVKKGDVLVTFDREDYDKELKRRTEAQVLAKLNFTKAEFEMAALEVSSPRDLQWAQRSARITQEDHATWLDTKAEYRDRRLAFDERAMHMWRENAAEELKQLKQMYEADELIEDTETIILKRNEFYNERSALDFEVNKKEYQYRLKYEIAREDEERERSLEDAALSLERTETLAPLNLEIARIAFAKTKEEFGKAEADFAKFQADAELLTVVAPADGVVYYGECKDGRWTTGAQMETVLDEGGKVQPEQVFMTIVAPKALRVRASMTEANLFELTEGCAVVAKPTGFPAERLAGSVSDVTIAPSLGGRYVFTASLTDAGDNVMAGMTCKVRVVVADKAKALQVPAASVFTDDDEDRRYVWLAGDEPVKQFVEVGFAKNGTLEILEGLAEGDEILKDAPQD